MEKGNVRIRDIHLFDENYHERYINSVCKSKDMHYDNLPILDGNRWSCESIRAGIKFVIFKNDGQIEDLPVENVTASETGDNELTIRIALKQKGEIVICCSEKEIFITFIREHNLRKAGLCFQWSNKSATAFFQTEKNDKEVISYVFNGYEYCLHVKDGRIVETEHENCSIILPYHTHMTLGFDSEYYSTCK
jgi:hypothetical protein